MYFFGVIRNLTHRFLHDFIRITCLSLCDVEITMTIWQSGLVSRDLRMNAPGWATLTDIVWRVSNTRTIKIEEFLIPLPMLYEKQCEYYKCQHRTPKWFKYLSMYHEFYVRLPVSSLWLQTLWKKIVFTTSWECKYLCFMILKYTFPITFEFI